MKQHRMIRLPQGIPGEEPDQQIDIGDLRRGVEAAAGFIEQWDAWVAGTPYRLSDIVRFKFNMIPRKALRKLHRGQRRFATLPGIER